MQTQKFLSSVSPEEMCSNIMLVLLGKDKVVAIGVSLLPLLFLLGGNDSQHSIISLFAICSTCGLFWWLEETWKGCCVVANLSARVGSNEDNHLGGWHSYRSSKSALNQHMISSPKFPWHDFLDSWLHFLSNLTVCWPFPPAMKCYITARCVLSDPSIFYVDVITWLELPTVC